MQSRAETVAAYLESLPEDRRKAVAAIRRTIRKHLPKGYEEGMQYGMIGYYVPHRVYPDGYHCDPKQPVPFASVASQKNHIAIYLMCIYGIDEHREWFIDAWKASGHKLDMGKACVRFKRIEDVPLDVVGQAIARVPVDEFLAHYTQVLAGGGERRAARKAAGKKKAAKKAPAKKAAKSTAKKKASKKAATKKAATKKAATKKAATKKAATKKAATKKAATKKAATKRSTAEKAAKKPAARQKAATRKR